MASKKIGNGSIGRTVIIALASAALFALGAVEVLRPRASAPADSSIYRSYLSSPSGEFELIEIRGRDALNTPYFSVGARRRGEVGCGIQVTGWSTNGVKASWRPDNSLEVREPSDQWFWWCLDDIHGFKIHRTR